MTCFPGKIFQWYKMLMSSITWPKIVALSKFWIKVLKETTIPSYTLLTQFAVLRNFFSITFFTIEQFNIDFFSRFRLLYFFSISSSPFQSPLWYFWKNKSPDLSSIHWTRFFFKIIQHCQKWNVTGLFPSYKLEEIEPFLFFKSVIIQIFVHQVCMKLLFYTVKLVESYKLYHTSRLM